MLKKYLNEDTIQLKQKVNSWQEAIQKAGQLLVNTNKIKEGYVVEMVQAVYDLGPYIVIAPGIAIAHARPSENVVAEGISMVTLETPVKFGHQTNDPVDIVFSFAAREQTGHLNALQNIVTLLGDESFINLLKENDNIKEIISRIAL